MFLFSFRFETESKQNQTNWNWMDSVNLASDSVTNRTYLIILLARYFYSLLNNFTFLHDRVGVMVRNYCQICGMTEKKFEIIYPELFFYQLIFVQKYFFNLITDFQIAYQINGKNRSLINFIVIILLLC